MHHTAKRHTTTHAAQLSLFFDSGTFVDVQHMVESGFLHVALFIVALLVLVVVCALFQGRPRPHAYSQEELDEIRIDRELAKEVSTTNRVIFTLERIKTKPPPPIVFTYHTFRRNKVS